MYVRVRVHAVLSIHVHVVPLLGSPSLSASFQLIAAL